MGIMSPAEKKAEKRYFCFNASILPLTSSQSLTVSWLSGKLIEGEISLVRLYCCMSHLPSKSHHFELLNI